MLALLLLPLVLLAEVRAGVQRGGIIRGHKAAPHSKPWMAYLVGKDGKQLCGGFLVREDFVMTAAHCFREDMRVILGAQNVKLRKPAWHVFGVKPEQHAGYNYKTMANDIMLLKLKGSARLDENVQLIPLPKDDKPVPVGTKCNVAGWGYTLDNKTSPDLLEADVTICSNDKCESNLKHTILDTMMCAGLRKEKTDAASYDSGGPLVCNGVAVGIVSYGTENSPPGVYTRISKYLDWIEGVLNREE